MASSNQGGSILSFLIIGGVLAVLLIGGAYALRQRSAQPASEPAPAVVQQPADKPANEAENKPAPATTDKQEAPKQEAAQPAPQPAPASTTELPRTGLADTFISVVGMSLLSGMIVAYARSRRQSVTL